MANLGNRSHLFHLVSPSPWPLLSSYSAFFLVSGFAFYMHKVDYSGYFMMCSLICLGYCVYFWFGDMMDEATYSGYHTLAVRMGLKTGFLLFIVSEIMLFFGFFWAFFHSALTPNLEIGAVFPPVGLSVIEVLEFPLYNTFMLIMSGVSVTWAHSTFSLCYYKEAIDSLLMTIFLGFFFMSLQMFEYYEAAYSFNSSVYGCSFYMLTGLHGMHVFVGASFLAICFFSLLSSHYTTTHYLGFIFAMWYWHFVDIVWMFLFMTVYCWGSW